MNITEVRIKLVDDSGENERLLAFCSITFDDSFVVRDLKIIGGPKGFFVAMPSRKLMDRCHSCGFKNQMRARFCNSCGNRLDESRGMRPTEGRAKLHADIAHPIHAHCREQIQAAVIQAFMGEREKSKLPGYVCTYDDIDQDFEPMSYAQAASEMNRPQRAHAPHNPPLPRSSAPRSSAQFRRVGYQYPAE